MFWKEVKGLSGLSLSSKIGITLFLITAGIGYLFGFLNIYLTYSPVDQEPGLSIKDIQITFYGARESTALGVAIDGSMRQYFQTDQDYNLTKEWIQNGGKQEDFALVKEVFDVSCSTCHSAEAQVADVVTVSYEDVAGFLKQDTGKSPGRLVSLSHTHILATVTVIFLLVLIFSFTTFSEVIKTIVIAYSFLSLIVDVGFWWLAKLSPAFAVFVILGGASLAVAFLVLIALSAYEVWLKKPESA